MEFQPRTWMFGHTHYSCDFNMGKTRIVSNQYGDVLDNEQTGYSLNKVIELTERQKFFAVVDIEATCSDQKGFDPSDMELIELGIVILNSKLDIVDKFESFVRPTENPVITPFCNELTGIDQASIDTAPSAKQVLETASRFLEPYSINKWLSWGKWDFDQIQKEASTSAFLNPLKNGHFSAKNIFKDTRKHKQTVGLNKALELSGLSWEGKTEH